MEAFGSERFLVFIWNWLCLCLVRQGYLISPFDRMWVQEQLVLLLYIVEHRHLAVSDNHQLLLFEGMEPRHKDVSFDAAEKTKKADRHISNLFMEVVPALGADALRHFAE